MKKLTIALFLSFILVNAGCKKEQLNDPGSLSVESAMASQKALSTITDISFVVTAVMDGQYYELSELQDGSRILKNAACSGNVTGKVNVTLSTFRISSVDAVVNPNYGLPDNWRELPYNYLVNGNGTIYIRSTDYFKFTMTDGFYAPGNYEAGVIGPDRYMGALFGVPIGNAPRPGSVQITEGYGKFKSLVGKKLEAYNSWDPTQTNRTTGTWKLIFRTPTY